MSSRNRQFRSKLRAGERQLGTLISIDSPIVSEVFATAGFDWLWIDCEHSPFDLMTIQSHLRVLGDLPCVVRVPALEEAAIKQALDVGATGVVIPQIGNLEAARTAVDFVKHPPLGRRGIGAARVNNYGASLPGYPERSNAETVIIVQAEEASVLDSIDEITLVEEIDVVLVGPNDLAASLGFPGKLDAPEVEAAITTILESCQRNNKAAGIFTANPAEAARRLAQGFTCVACGLDTIVLRQAAQNLMHELNSEIKNG